MNEKRGVGFPRRGLAVALVLVVAIAGSGVLVSAGPPLVLKHQIGGFLGNQAIEIDDQDNNPTTTPDANMEIGDPTTCSFGPDPDCPFVAGATYIDWNDLAEEPGGGPPAGKYVMIDGTGNTDDSFAGTGTSSCLQQAHAAPQKEDIYRAYLANNSQYLYFGLVDKSASGDSRHVILFHKNPITTGASCAGGGTLLYLDLTTDDRLILATFKPSATEPAARVFSVVDDPVDMYINDAANYANTSIWTPTASAVNFAVNTTAIPEDLLGSGQPNSNPVMAETFGEGAVSLASLGITGCGGQYQVSVITRSSGSGGGEAKDFIGGQYDFGSLALTASLSPSCNAEFGYTAQATDQDGAPLPDTDVTYAWTCSSGPLAFSFTGKSGTRPAAAKAYDCSVTATASSGCNAEVKNLTVNVWDPLSVVVDAVPSCSLTENSYSAVVSGGSGSVSHAWSDTGVTFSDAIAASGTYDVGAAGIYTLRDDVTDLRDDLPPGECTAWDSDQVQLSSLSATAQLDDSCTLTFDYDSTVSGDLGTVSYAWSFSGDTTVTPATSIAASGTASVAPPGGNYNGDLTVTDLRTDIGDPSIAPYSCDATASDPAVVWGPIDVNIVPDTESLMCMVIDTAGTDITYTADASGGDGNYIYTWTVNGPNSAVACGDATTCLVDFYDDDYCATIDVKVNVVDALGLCAAQDSEIEYLTKTTTVAAPNQPPLP